VLTDLPMLGYAVGAAAWILQRVVGAAVESRARSAKDIRTAVGLGLGGSLARAWFVGLAILAVGLTAEREDGLMAAVLVLAAYTVYLVASLILRPFERNTPRP
jgi:hypothetical protein